MTIPAFWCGLIAGVGGIMLALLIAAFVLGRKNRKQ